MHSEGDSTGLLYSSNKGEFLHLVRDKCLNLQLELVLTHFQCFKDGYSYTPVSTDVDICLSHSFIF